MATSEQSFKPIDVSSAKSLEVLHNLRLVDRPPADDHERLTTQIKTISAASQKFLDTRSDGLPLLSGNLLIVPTLSPQLPVHTEFGLLNAYSAHAYADRRLFQTGNHFTPSELTYSFDELNAHGVEDEAGFGVPLALERFAGRIVACSWPRLRNAQSGRLNIAGAIMLAAVNRSIGQPSIQKAIRFPQYDPVAIAGREVEPVVLPVSETSISVYGAPVDKNSAYDIRVQG